MSEYRVTRVEPMREIASRWKAEGKSFRPSDVEREWDRQRAWYVRTIESHILANETAETGEVAGQIRDHRACGNWTTQQRDPAPEHPHI